MIAATLNWMNSNLRGRRAAIFREFAGHSHLMGFEKAFEYAELPQLTRPISWPLGLVWLAAACWFYSGRSHDQRELKCAPSEAL